MKKTFCLWQVDQSLLFPPAVHDFAPPDHSAHFVRELVRDALDFVAITDSYGGTKLKANASKHKAMSWGG